MGRFGGQGVQNVDKRNKRSKKKTRRIERSNKRETMVQRQCIFRSMLHSTHDHTHTYTQCSDYYYWKLVKWGKVVTVLFLSYYIAKKVSRLWENFSIFDGFFLSSSLIYLIYLIMTHFLPLLCCCRTLFFLYSFFGSVFTCAVYYYDMFRKQCSRLNDGTLTLWSNMYSFGLYQPEGVTVE